MKIMLVEDNETISEGLAYAFRKNGFDIVCFTRAKDAAAFLSKPHNINLVILDISLPDGNGFRFYSDTVKPLDIPTVFLTARDDENDIVKGLESGAEDYITKPFGIKELIARVNKILKRSAKRNIIVSGDIAFDMDKMLLTKNGKETDLTPLELKIVNLLFANINTVVTRNTLLDKIWDWTGNFVDDHTVTVYLNRIREKIGSDVIITVKGIGYRIDEKQNNS